MHEAAAFYMTVTKHRVEHYQSNVVEIKTRSRRDTIHQIAQVTSPRYGGGSESAQSGEQSCSAVATVGMEWRLRNINPNNGLARKPPAFTYCATTTTYLMLLRCSRQSVIATCCSTECGLWQPEKSRNSALISPGRSRQTMVNFCDRGSCSVSRAKK